MTYELDSASLCDSPHTGIRIHPGDVLAPFGRRHIEVSVSGKCLFKEIPRYILIEHNLLRLPMRQLPVCNLRPLEALACAPALAERTFRRRWVRLMTAKYQADKTIEHIEVPLEAKKKIENASATSRGPYKKRPRPIVSMLTLHYFRHNFASVLYANGVDVLTAQKWLGHKKVETTLGIYAHLSRRREKIDVAKIQAAFAIPKAIGN